MTLVLIGVTLFQCSSSCRSKVMEIEHVLSFHTILRLVGHRAHNLLQIKVLRGRGNVRKKETIVPSVGLVCFMRMEKWEHNYKYIMSLILCHSILQSMI